jgi:glucose-6-phosphate dehydrogenase assembly protein OpcA
MAEDVAMPEDLTMLGTPVEVGAISTELKKLWLADQTRTRATLFNFAIICEGEESMRENTELLARFVGSHAFRAILIGIEPSSAETTVKAWINAHCYLPKAGGKHVCSEQVSLFIRGDVRAVLPNLLFQQLDYDLPLTLWWRAKDFEHVHPEVWRWVDRLLFDSQVWANPGRELLKLRDAVGRQRTAMCDLAWTRTLHLRQSLAQMFDTPEHANALQHLRRVAITYAPGARTAAVLLLSWLAAQLNWSHSSERGQHMRFRVGGNEVISDLLELPGIGISRVELHGEALTVIATRTAGTRFLHIEAREAEGRVTQHLMPADCEGLAGTLDEELASWGRHGVYRKVLAVAGGVL